MKDCHTCKYCTLDYYQYPCSEYKDIGNDVDYKHYEPKIPPQEKQQPQEEINHPDRYAGGKFECIDVMQDIFGVEAVKHFCILNAFKYLWRAEKKNGVEDIKKAVWYLNKYIELGGEDT